MIDVDRCHFCEQYTSRYAFLVYMWPKNALECTASIVGMSTATYVHSPPEPVANQENLSDPKDL